jgi:prolyl-tRNA editing enzyme YbaK/EbsC (Cys-tRNA(Pro) deacylase)
VKTLEHPGVAKVTAALTEAGLSRAAGSVRVLDADVRTAAQAAAAVGVEVGAIANSLLFRVTRPGEDDTALLVLTSGAHRADTDTLADLLARGSGAGDQPSKLGVRMADPDFVRAHTGQVIGGVAPLGHPSPIRTIVDPELGCHPVVWAAAGHPKAVFPTTLEELVRVTGGTSAPVAAVGEGGSSR